MKEGLIHLCFVIDESGSMYNSVNDVLGGFKKLIEDQKKDEKGECIISLYKFNGYVRNQFIGKDVNEIEELQYNPNGSTALFDAIGTAIDEIGDWLSKMPEDERPSKNMIIIMTDGEENYSSAYSTEKVKSMIKHQEEKYDWTFVYMGTELDNFNDADNIGIKVRSITSRRCLGNSYDRISTYATAYKYASDDSMRSMAFCTLDSGLSDDTNEYLKSK